MPESPQAVAYALLQRIAIAEDWSGTQSGDATLPWHKSRQEILDAYRECLDAVLGTHKHWGAGGAGT